MNTSVIVIISKKLRTKNLTYTSYGLKMLLSNSLNREHLKNFRNVDCVLANHNNFYDCKLKFSKKHTIFAECWQCFVHSSELQLNLVLSLSFSLLSFFKILNKHLSIFIFIPSSSFQFFTCILLDAFKSSK